MEHAKEILDDVYEKKDVQGYIKAYMLIKGYALGKELPQTMIALPLARRLHNGQYRKSGEPYLTHPLKVCTNLISFGIDDDVTLAAAILHDVLEDCGEKLPMGGKELVSEYGLKPEVLEIVELLSKRSGMSDSEMTEYFLRIEHNPRAALIKLTDRLHNSSTMYAFSDARMAAYIEETETCLLPMASYCKKYYPPYSNAFNILKTVIGALNSSMKMMLVRAQNQREEERAKEKEMEKIG